ncbi:MAG TPA: glucose-6-phosphate isomerase, partial [Cryobacterium sp.]|nr:glucose-6-phosphate isomerase [Cryobacterium sp.]
GGSAKGVFLQITTTGSTDLFIPGRPFTFEQLLAAQAAGDTQALLDQDLPVITLTLPAPESNLTHLMAALG